MLNVQVQAGACVDEVSFLFMGGVPGWSVGYRSSPLTQDPSGQPAPIAGAAHLVVQLQPASGVDLSHDYPMVTYDGPLTMSPAAPSGVTQMRQLGDFEAVTSWAIGLPDRRPFQVVARQDQLVIRVGAPTPRATRCGVPGANVSVGYPDDWYAELSDRWACRYFDPSPFAVFPATDNTTWAVSVRSADAPAADVVGRMTASDGGIRSHSARVADLPATVLDVTATGQGLLPAGYGFRMYVVATTPSALLISSAPAPPGPQADRNRAGADRIADLLRTV